MAEAEVPGTLVPEVPTIARARARRDDLFDRLWRLLSSVRFAILLISLVLLGVFAGTLIMQAPADVVESPDQYAAWLRQPQGKYGQPWANIFAALDLYRVFRTPWFVGTLAVLSLSVVVCTLNRMPGILASIRRPAVKVPERLFDRAPLRAEFQLDTLAIDTALPQLAAVLRSYRYRLLPWQDGAARALFGDRNRFGKAGTFLNHIGIVTILAAAVLGSDRAGLGWRENAFMVPEGSTRPVGHNTGITVRNDGFVDEYFPNGTPSDYRSDLVLLQGDRELAHKTIRVNDPLDFNGVRFHQAFFGPAAVMRVTDPNGSQVFNDGVALGYQFDGGDVTRNGGFFTLGNRNGLPTLAVYVLVPAPQRGVDPAIPAGSVRLEIFEPRQARPSYIETMAQGTPKDIAGYTFEFVRERQFSGLQVVHNPAVPVIWLGSAFMLAGMLIVFNFPLRRVWLRLDPAAGQLAGVRVRLAAVSNRDVLFAREFERLALDIDAVLRRLAPPGPPAAAALAAPLVTESLTAPAEPVQV